LLQLADELDRIVHGGYQLKVFFVAYRFKAI